MSLIIAMLLSLTSVSEGALLIASMRSEGFRDTPPVTAVMQAAAITVAAEEFDLPADALYAICWVESACDLTAVGQLGELGAFQQRREELPYYAPSCWMGTERIPGCSDEGLSVEQMLHDPMAQARTAALRLRRSIDAGVGPDVSRSHVSAWLLRDDTWARRYNGSGRYLRRYLSAHARVFEWRRVIRTGSEPDHRSLVPEDFQRNPENRQTAEQLAQRMSNGRRWLHRRLLARTR